MEITRGLIIADPWIGYILDGTKTWEMRSTSTSHRGWFGLIRKGSGQVFGIARLVGCGAPLSQAEMIAAHDLHRIPEMLIRSGDVAKWVVPWKLADVRKLPTPIPYVHKTGAVTWVNFDSHVQTELAQLHSQLLPTLSAGFLQDDESASLIPPSPSFERRSPIKGASQTAKVGSKLKSKERPQNLMNSPDTLVGKSVLTGGNIRNNHFYLTDFLDMFPPDSIGGSNKASRAPKQISIDWGGPAPVHTDIDQTKRLFRARGWVRNFFASTNAAEGDAVVVERSASHSFRIRLDKAASK